MALKNRVHVFTWKYDGDEIKLQANFSALEELAEEVGMDALVYIQTMETERHLVEVFYHLQYETEYSRKEIHECFFAEAIIMQGPEMIDQLQKLVAHLVGGEKAVKLYEETKSQQKQDDKKK